MFYKTGQEDYLFSVLDMKDIFNADETGIFFQALPSRSMIAKVTMLQVLRLAK